MARWAPDTRERLRAAALALFEERGYAATTVPDIVARAGVTRRTFFRHFADKREVFFDGDEIPELAARMIATAPAHLAPMTVVVQGLHSLARERFEPRRAEIRFARSVIAAEPALRERDLRKQADLRDAIRRGFTARGEDERTAAAVAGITVEALQSALDAWASDVDEVPLTDHLDAAFDRMRAVLRVG
ncbi:TetR family transcriptional regulator [Microbacterium oleivorans]|uniref:TetR family transcriptional regulator n=1 Tax=Microbacterium TaxID=33882 RepID=UPI00203F7714|nr:TetR family transcriptional regulator [Microbacterium oleivorans]MCM3695545.1 TetR family transcriptional regulator [Microbacterium oleivorans]